MSRTEGELWGLLREAYQMPYGSAQIALVEQVIQHADAAELDELRFAARMQATTAYVHGGEPAKSFVTFSWCLAEYDRHPERYDRQDESLLLWHFKYMVGGLTKFPEVPLARTYDVLDDMERRYRAGGHSLHAVYAYRWRVAEHVGDPSAEDWYAKWCATPRDENSDCVGCDPTSKVEHLAARGRDEDAVALASPVLGGRLTCVEQPQSILTELLVPYLRTGRLTEAADAHRRGYRRLRGNLADLAAIGSHVAFCALTGNEPRGLELVERHVDWLDWAPSPFAAMWFAASSALLLRRLADGGHADLRVRHGDSEVPAAELGARLATFARDRAARFDARNGTDRVGTLIAQRLAAEPFVARLPLNAVDRAVSGLGGAAGAAGGSVPAGGSDAAQAPPDAESRDGAPREGAPPPEGAARSTVVARGGPVPAEPLPDQPGALLDQAERMLRLGHVDDAKVAWRRFDELFAEPEPVFVARRLDARGMVLSIERRLAEAERVFREAAAAHAAAGAELAGLASTGRAASIVCANATEHDDDDRYAEGLAELTEASERIIATGPPDRRAGAHLRLGNALGQGRRYTEALDRVERAAVEAGGAGDPVLDAEVEARRAQCLLMLERFAEAVDVARVARERFAAFGDSPAAAVPSLIHGHALAHLDRMEAAIEAFDAAVRLAKDPELLLSARVARGRARRAAGQPIGAIEDLVEAVAEHIARGEDVPAAFLRFDLAGAYHDTGQLLDAAEAAEAAVDVLDRAGAQDPADRTRYLLSRVYRDLGEADQALALLDRLAENLDGFDNLPARGQMLEEAAQILYAEDRDAQAALRFGAAATAYHTAALPLDELRARRWRAVALRWADEPDAALAALGEADVLAAALPPDEPASIWERAMLGYDAARVYAGADRSEEALARITGCAAAFRGIEAYGEALHVDLLHGELLLRLDRPAEAEPILRQVLGGAPHDSQLRDNSAWLLSEALEALGRTDEAEALRREHHLDT